MATELIRGLYNLRPGHQGCVATIGNFDGVHRGHQTLLARVKSMSAALGLPSVVITFEPQPAEFFSQGNSAKPRLTRWREKFNAIAAAGIDRVLVLHFDERIANLNAEDFVKQILCQGLGVHHVVVGDDFRFGKGRHADFEFLKNAGAGLGFSVESMPSFMLDGERVSSTRVRKALAEDNHDLVAKLLGHPYHMKGRVVYGARRGRSMGFPTANIYLHRQATPVQGVYAVRMHGLTDSGLRGVANVGVRPTVGGTRTQLEVYLFDFNQDIYGRHVCVEFCKKLRDEKRFESLDLLKEQIKLDAEQARQYFKVV